jgi:GT2 family glycosyltransferase
MRGKCLNIGNGLPYLQSTVYNLQSYLVWGSSAALVVYNKKIITKIGLFDEDFFAYEEDVDLALRLNYLGYKTLYIPSALSYHLGGGTSRQMGNFRYRMDAKNWFYIIIKNYSLKEIITNLLPITEERLRNLSGLIKNTPILLIPWSILRTYFTVIIKIPSMIKKRNQIKKLLKSNQ